MSYRILKKDIEQIFKDATVAANNDGIEICGLLIYNGFFIELLKVRNKNKRGGGFAFYSSEIKLLQKAVNMLNHEIIGTFHSHPAYIAEPSESDIAYALDDSYMLIIDVLDKKVALWYIKGLTKKKINIELIS